MKNLWHRTQNVSTQDIVVIFTRQDPLKCKIQELKKRPYKDFNTE